MPYQSCQAEYKMGCIKLWLLCDATEYRSSMYRRNNTWFDVFAGWDIDDETRMSLI